VLMEEEAEEEGIIKICLLYFVYNIINFQLNVVKVNESIFYGTYYF
jgi:hypothetical protein